MSAANFFYYLKRELYASAFLSAVLRLYLGFMDVIQLFWVTKLRRRLRHNFTKILQFAVTWVADRAGIVRSPIMTFLGSPSTAAASVNRSAN